VILLENDINCSIRAEVYHPKLRLVFKYKAHSSSRRCHGEELIYTDGPRWHLPIRHPRIGLWETTVEPFVMLNSKARSGAKILRVEFKPNFVVFRDAVYNN
jgi:hypothetical protein